MNALEAYRRTQEALRKEFDPLTARLCPQCPDPCCRVPAQVTPVDVAIAVACGWTIPPEMGIEDPISAAAGQAGLALALQVEHDVAQACPFLGTWGCTFPRDVRPYGCTAFVCRFLNERLGARGRARVRRLLHQLARDYARLSPTFARRFRAAR